MDLKDIGEVIEVITDERVNRLLDDGWILLDTHVDSYKIPIRATEVQQRFGYKDLNEVVYEEHAKRTYLLGKPRE